LSVTIKNEGTAALSVTSQRISGGNAGEFSIVSGGGSFSLNPGDSFVVIIRFSPLSLGAKSALYEIKSNDPDENSIDIILMGTGIKFESNTYCYPNPFNPLINPAKIYFKIGYQNFVKIKIIDEGGDLVKVEDISLSDNNSDLSYFLWDGKNDRGEFVSNGIYFYQLKSDEGEKLWGKICIIK